MEISGPVLISSSNPTAAARIGELSGGLSSSAPSQVRDDGCIDTYAAYQTTIQPRDGWRDLVIGKQDGCAGKKGEEDNERPQLLFQLDGG